MVIPFPNFTDKRIVVFGDAILDVYYWGDVERISPEAPVPVFRVQRKTKALGGAGNVALNLVRLGCRPTLLGMRGADPSGERLAQLIDEEGIAGRLGVTTEQPTTTKTRVIVKGQQLMRIDEEEPQALTAADRDALLAQFETCLPQTDAVILSDYAKGVFAVDLAAEVIARSRKHAVPVFVDPKCHDWRKYQGAFCITPNLTEFKRARLPETEDNDDLVSRARRLIDTYELTYILITMGPRGITLVGKDGLHIHIPTRAREVYDVSGAGDTLISTLSATVAAGTDMPTAAAIANQAAGVVVAKLGTQPVSDKELKLALWDQKISAAQKLSSRKAARDIVAAWQADGHQVVFTNGCFDILHVGHVKLLQSAAEQGDKLIVALNSDASVRRLKGNSRPVMPEEARAVLLANIHCVDMVVIFEEDTPLSLIKALRPDVLVKGDDYKSQDVVGAREVESWGGRLVLIPLVSGFSTSGLIEAMRAGDGQE